MREDKIIYFCAEFIIYQLCSVAKVSRSAGFYIHNNMQEDPIVNAVTAVVAGLNPITNAIFTGISMYRNEIEMRFLKDVVIAVNEKVHRLERKLDKDYMKSDDYMNFIYRTLNMAIKDVRKEKINLFSNIIVNAALSDNTIINDCKKYLYEETIDKIDEGLFKFLLKMSTRVLNSFETNARGWTENSEDLKMLGVDAKSFQYNSEYLLSVGVLIRIPKFEIDNGSGMMTYHEEYFVTQYGKEFVDFVKEQ